MPDGRLTIATRRYSSWSMRGWLAVRLAGLDVEEVVIPVSGTGTTEAIRRVSPNGRVPFLEHRGHRVWESLAIIEYCAELSPGIWPADLAARTHARAISAEMHAGFAALRSAMPMNLGRPDFAGRGRTPEALADIARIEALWAETRERFGLGGTFLFGEALNGADAMFAPVVTRFLTYRPDLLPATLDYCDAVRRHPLVDEWYAAVPAESDAWLIPTYENPS
jgi:glutathione S-transferase